MKLNFLYNILTSLTVLMLIVVLVELEERVESLERQNSRLHIRLEVLNTRIVDNKLIIVKPVDIYLQEKDSIDSHLIYY